MGRVLLLIVGFVVALGLAGVSPPQQRATEQQAHARQPNTETQPRPPSPQVQDADPLDEACEQDQDKRTSDLCAQWKAADSAYESAVWTRRTGYATWIGLIVGMITMGAAIAAALFARDAAAHTKRSADSGDQMAREAATGTAAALRSATVAEKALVGIERPFVVIKPIRANKLYAAYTFSNYGRTPAVIMHSEVRYLAITPNDCPEPIRASVLQVALSPGWTVVPPGGEAAGEEIAQSGKPIVEGADSAHMNLLHGYVMYRSLTGEIFISGFGIYRKDDEPWKGLRGDTFNYDERLEKGGPRKRHRPTITATAYKPKK